MIVVLGLRSVWDRGSLRLCGDRIVQTFPSDFEIVVRGDIAVPLHWALQKERKLALTSRDYNAWREKWSIGHPKSELHVNIFLSTLSVKFTSLESMDFNFTAEDTDTITSLLRGQWRFLHDGIIAWGQWRFQHDNIVFALAMKVSTWQHHRFVGNQGFNTTSSLLQGQWRFQGSRRFSCHAHLSFKGNEGLKGAEGLDARPCEFLFQEIPLGVNLRFRSISNKHD